jgi:hypothetical protein
MITYNIYDNILRHYLDAQSHELNIGLVGRLRPAHQGALLEVVDQQLVEAGVGVQVDQKELVFLHLYKSVLCGKVLRLKRRISMGKFSYR